MLFHMLLESIYHIHRNDTIRLFIYRTSMAHDFKKSMKNHEMNELKQLVVNSVSRKVQKADAICPMM